MFRPQFPFPPAPRGFVWQPCLYQFSQNNVPALGNLNLAAGQQTGHIPLPLDKDAPFRLMAAKIQNGGVDVLLYDPEANQLMDTFVSPSEYANELQPFTVLEGPGIDVPAGAVFAVRLQGQ